MPRRNLILALACDVRVYVDRLCVSHYRIADAADAASTSQPSSPLQGEGAMEAGGRRATGSDSTMGR